MTLNGELYQYTSEFLRNIGFDVHVIDFKNPSKSCGYNFLQPVIDSINNNDFIRAEEKAWDIAQALVTSDTKIEQIWLDGQKSIIAGTILTIVYENKEKPEYQNMSNVYMFISEMSKKNGNDIKLNKYIENLDENHIAKKVFSVALVAPEKTRASFFTSALATLNLFSNKSIYSMTSITDFAIENIGRKSTAIYIILPDEKVTYYPLASLLVYQIYCGLVNEADNRGGQLKVRVNYILDEFGNFVQIPAFSNMLTVSRR